MQGNTYLATLSSILSHFLITSIPLFSGFSSQCSQFLFILFSLPVPAYSFPYQICYFYENLSPSLLILENFQAGLTWECVLNKREAFRRAFDGFDLRKVASYSEEKLTALQADSGIIRNRLKIWAAVVNAQVFQKIQQEWGSFDRYLWHWTDENIIQEVDKVSSPLSDAVSKDLKKRGMKFVGPIIIYAYLQAVGVINSHESGCFQNPLQQ